MNTYEDVVETILFEWQEMFADRDYDGSTLDLGATAREVWQHLEGNGTIDSIEAMPEQWQREETTHNVVLDWFSMFEPITIARSR